MRLTLLPHPRNVKDGGYPLGETTRRGSGMTNGPHQLLARF